MKRTETYTLFELPVTGAKTAVVRGKRLMKAEAPALYNGRQDEEGIEVFRTITGRLAFYRSYVLAGYRELKEFDSPEQAKDFLGCSKAGMHVKVMFGVPAY